ncbi:hypothetical protein UA08_00906 [Talaromyces atroroseus]|uniref:Uncharacterized protein n=1 Tax=Talaromyces atroroseus TaxID=1441469 RepID=A0A225AQ31_TALAT|nr:hypothetical protein UA08_00906 [Talaromyces atroroseus]OKL63731.1 hypothetical protein UA08_00906 [Talaromyces atroroseus]
MRHLSQILSTISLTLFYVLPTLAITGGKAWVNFYKDCPAEIIEVEEFTVIVPSSVSQAKGVASPTLSPSSSSIRTPSSSSASVLPSSSSSSSIPSERSQFRSLLAARSTEKTTIRSPAVNITQGQCQPVHIATSTHLNSRSVSVEAELINVLPFQQCNITVHEVAGCIDPPLVVAPVKNRDARSACKPRNFDAFDDVWVKLDCSEVGTGSPQNTVSRTRPVRRVF